LVAKVGEPGKGGLILGRLESITLVNIDGVEEVRHGDVRLAIGDDRFRDKGVGFGGSKPGP